MGIATGRVIRRLASELSYPFPVEDRHIRKARAILHRLAAARITLIELPEPVDGNYMRHTGTAAKVWIDNFPSDPYLHAWRGEFGSISFPPEFGRAFAAAILAATLDAQEGH